MNTTNTTAGEAGVTLAEVAHSYQHRLSEYGKADFIVWATTNAPITPEQAMQKINQLTAC